MSTKPMQCKPHISAIIRVETAHPERNGKLRLDRNERVSPFPPHVLEDIRELVTSELIQSYPDVSGTYDKLSRHLGIERESLLLSHASDSAIKSVFDVYLRENDDAVILDPTYSMYPLYAMMQGGRAVKVPFQANLSLPFESLLSAITSNTRLVCVPNPNQPIERVFSREEITILLELAERDNFLLLVDEAYHYFSPETALDLVKGTDRLIITRTFSKAFGMAGLRAGLTIAHPDRIRELRAVKPISEVNSFANALIGYFLDHYEHVEKHVDEVNQGRKHIIHRAVRAGITFHGTTGNSILLDLGSAKNVSQAIAQGISRSVLLKGFSEFPLERYIRVTLGSPQYMDTAMDIIEEVTQ